MKKLNTAWKKVVLNESIIIQLANISFTEKDWFMYFRNYASINADILIDLLFLNEVITLEQRDTYITVQEWTPERRAATGCITAENPSLTHQDHARLRRLTLSIAILENRVDQILNKK